MIGYTPVEQDRRKALGLPPATGADDPHAQTCWADPLSRMERKELRLKLARACKSFWLISGPCWIEMADLHLDVTERAEVPAS